MTVASQRTKSSMFYKMGWVYIVKNNEEREHQLYSEDKPPKKNVVLQYVVQGLGALSWFMTTFKFNFKPSLGT